MCKHSELIQNHTFGTSGRHSSRSAFGRLTGNDVSGHYKRHYSFFLVFPPLSTFLIEGCSEQKTYLGKVDGSSQKPRCRHVTRPVSHLGPSSGHFGFSRKGGISGCERVPPGLLGWYFNFNFNSNFLFFHH